MPATASVLTVRTGLTLLSLLPSFGATMVFTARAVNEKTGNVPTAWIGRTIAESRKSCAGCAQLAKGNCYAQFGSALKGMGSIMRKARREKSWRGYTIERALKRRHKAARMVRFSALGDVARANRTQLEAAFAATLAAGLAIVGFTHFWKTDGADLKGRVMASCDNPEMAREANALGWRAAIVEAHGTVGTIRNPDGSIFAVECPAVAAQRHGKVFTCNDCASTKRGALCDASVKAPNVYFPDHGPATRRRVSLAIVQ